MNPPPIRERLSRSTPYAAEPPFSDLLAALNGWFASAARILPWRSDPTPYRVWISEIMLQQTVVATVIPYFRRFVARFPDVKSLADASVDEVLTFWSGLGYYSRARNLHKTARILADNGFPETRAGWEALPGVGPYTAGAVLSIAFDRPEAILDGNIERVWARFRCVPRGDRFKEHLWRLSRYAVETTLRCGLSPSVINQALMELGALVCRPSKPECHSCPFSPRCRACASGKQDDYPQRRTGNGVETIEETVYVYMLADGRVYLPPPSESQRWRKGMRDFPTEEIPGWRPFVRYLGRSVTTHSVTRYKVIRTAEVYMMESPAVALRFADSFFGDLTRIPYSAACLKTFKILSNFRQ